MTAVERVRVGDVLQLQRRSVAVDPSLEYEEIGVRSFGRGIFHKEPIDGSVLGDKRVFAIEPGDLVISNVFAWEGAIAVASDAEVGRVGSHRFMTFVPTDKQVDVGWARWFLLSEPGLALLRQASPGSAGRNKTLAIKRFEDLVIPTPPIEEQWRVASRLDRAASVAERVGGLNGRSDALTSALIESLLAGGQVSHSPRQIELGEVIRLDEQKVAVDPIGNYPMVGVYSFGRGLFERGELTGSATSYTTLNRIRAGQIVMSRLKAWEGALGGVPARFDGRYVSPEFPTFTPDADKADQRFVDALVTSPRFWSQLSIGARGIGARRERIHAQRLLEQRVLLPPIDIQRRIADCIERIEATRARRAAAMTRVEAIQPALLNAEFSSLGADD